MKKAVPAGPPPEMQPQISEAPPESDVAQLYAHVQAVWSQVSAIAAGFSDQMAAGAKEAEELLEAASDDSDLPTLAAHISKHPPGAFAIAHLIWRVRAATEDTLSRRKLPDSVVHHAFDALSNDSKTVPALREALLNRGLEVPDDKNLRAALRRGKRTASPAKRGRRPKPP